MKSSALLGFILLAACCAACTLGNLPTEENQPEEPLSGSLVLDQPNAVQQTFCLLAEQPFVTDLSVYQTPNLAEPAPRQAYQDPVFGTCIVRVTDRQADISNPSDTSAGMKNEYARVQAFNADGTLLIARSLESYWYVYDANTLQPLGEIPAFVEPRWDAQDPTLLYYSDETRLMSYDLLSGTINQVHDFAGDLPGQKLAAVWTRYEGSPSFDTRYWGLVAQDEDWEPAAFLVYDLQADSVISREIPPGYSIDHVTVSPLGGFFMASFDEYCEHNQPRTADRPCGLMVYDRNLENGRSLLRIIGHYDTALDAEGREVVVYQDIDTDRIAMLDLASGAVTPLMPIDFSHTGIGFHFSGRAAQRPGWVLVSTYNGGHPQNFTWMDNAIFAVELKSGGRVVRLAHTQSVYNENEEHDYWAEPHASVNHDLTRIVFTSNWGRSGTEEVEMYMIFLPENWIDSLPPTD